MAFEDMLKSNASIMEAYKKMYQKDSGTQKEDVLEESKITKKEVEKVEKELEKVADEIKESTPIEEGIGDERDRYALHRAHGQSSEGHTHAIVHKMDHSNVAKTFPDRHSAIEHLNNSEMTGTHRVVSIESTHKLRESTDEDEEKNINDWMDKVKTAHPDKMLKFKNRIESGTHTTSAEVSGEDRSYGVWDHDKKEGHVFTEAKEISEQSHIVATMDQPHAGHYTAYGRKFATYSFPTSHAANEFMTTPQGEKYGFIGVSDDGHFHVAHMDDNGSTAE